jgi:hypothetical protein
MYQLEIFLGIFIIALIVYIIASKSKEKNDLFLANAKIRNDALEEIQEAVKDLDGIVTTLSLYIKDENVRRELVAKLETNKKSIHHGVARLIDL